MSDADDYYPPRDLVREASQAEDELSKMTEVSSGGFLVVKPVPVISFADLSGTKVNLEAGDLARFLKPLVRPMAYDGAPKEGRPPVWPRVHFRGSTSEKIRSFILVYFVQLRSLVCKNNTKNFPLSNQTTVVTAGIAVWLVETFGIKDTLAKSLATTILIALLTATKGTFCLVTAEAAKEILASIND